MTPVCTYTDYFVICTGQNPRQTKAIYDEVHAALKAEARIAAGLGRRRARGERGSSPTTSTSCCTSSRPEARKYYALEDLWGDVPSVSVEAVSA